ncbi:MAG: hypothetical protein KAJ19_23370 [Gammaproteobacteria bacterium]|nr:hypothetical protein [Gammaproteobacteria bacterium]
MSFTQKIVDRIARIEGGQAIEDACRRLLELERDRDTLRRALEKAAETMVEHVSCPMVMYGWSHPSSCDKACGMGEKECWLQYFKE